MKITKILIGIIFTAGLLVGMLCFLPLDAIRSRVLADIGRQTQVEISMGTLSLGSGLDLGFSDWSLFALRGSDAVLSLPNGQLVKCKKLILGPKIFPFLIGRLSAALRCELKQSGQITASLSGAPFWNPKDLSLTLNFQNFNMSMLEQYLDNSPIGGQLSGTVELKDFNPKASGISDAAWDLVGSDVLLPPVNQDFLSLPALPLGPMNIKGNFQRSKLKIEEFKFGKKDSMLEGIIVADLGINSQSGMLTVTGDMSGRLRTDAEFEKTQLKDIGLTLAFGPVKASGFREFKKKANGGVQSLLMNPPLDN